MPTKIRRIAGDKELLTPSRRGCKARPIIEYPTPVFTEWVDPHFPRSIHSAPSAVLGKLLSASPLHHPARGKLDRATLQSWTEGRRAPRSAASFEILARIEQRYGLPLGYFKAKLPNPARAVSGVTVKGMPRAEQRRLAWHLPEDFNSRSLKEQSEILDWVQNVVISGATEYRRFQAQAMKLR